MTHTYITTIDQPTLHCLTRSVRRRAATSKRGYRSGLFFKFPITRKSERFPCAVDFTGYATNQDLSEMRGDFQGVQSVHEYNDQDRWRGPLCRPFDGNGCVRSVSRLLRPRTVRAQAGAMVFFETSGHACRTL